MKTVFNVIFRLMALPFLIMVILIARLRDLLFLSFYFLCYGGEWISHMKDDKKYIYEIYEELKKQRNEPQG